MGISDVFIYDKNFNPQLLDIGNGGEYEGSIQTVAGGGNPSNQLHIPALPNQRWDIPE